MNVYEEYMKNRPGEQKDGAEGAENEKPKANESEEK